MYIFSPQLIEFWKTYLITVKERFIPLFLVLVLFISYRIVIPSTSDLSIIVIQILSAIIFIHLPSLLYVLFPKTEEGLSWVDIASGLWVWLPIEFGIIDDFLGPIEMGNIPFPTLIALFAFLYALIFFRNLEMGLTFTLTKRDIKLVALSTGIITLIILPLGIVSAFLATPDRILQNAMTLINGLPRSLLEIIQTFILIFLGIALIEEIFFRGFIYRLLVTNLQTENISESWSYAALLGLILLIIITPWVDDILLLLSQWIPYLLPIQMIVGSLAEPLGEAEGQAWPLVQTIPLETLYLLVALIIGSIAFISIFKFKNPMITALILSSILFGWAHFEDIRYIFFASIAGFGYGWVYEKSGKIVPAALVHMTIDAVWSLILT